MSILPHQHPSFRDRWNPYRERQYIGHRLDKRHFEAMLDCSETGKALHSIDSLGGGILDAPEEIPYGSTLLVRTIGGWVREEYNRCPRWALHMTWQERQDNDCEMAEMLRSILDEATKGEGA